MAGSLGDLVIRVGGNIDGFRSAMTDASDSATQFTSKISSTVAEGVTLFDAYGRAVESVAAPIKKLTEGNAQLAAASERVISSLGGQVAVTEKLATANSHAVSEIQATSGALRTLEGNGGIRAAERFIATTLGLGSAMQAIFVPIGALALASAVARIGEEVYKVAQNFFFLKDAEEEAIKVGAGLADGAQAALDKITAAQVQALRNQGKLVEAARLEQQNLLSKSIKMPNLVDNDKFKQLDSTQNQSELNALRSVFSDVIPADLPARIQEINAGIARTSQELAAIKAAGFDPTFLNSHFAGQAKVELDLYGQALEFLQVKQRDFAQSVGMAGSNIPKAHKEEAAAAEAAARKVSDALKSTDEDSLAVLKSNHLVSLTETIKFWKDRLAVESGNALRSHEIGITLGNLAQEQDKAEAKITENWIRLNDEKEKKMEAFKGRIEELAQEATQLAEKMGAEIGDRNKKLFDIGAKSTGNAEEGAGAFKKLEAERAYSLQVDHGRQAELAYAQKILAADDEISNAKIAALTAEQEAEADEIKKAELGLELQKAIIDAAEKRFAAETKILDALNKQNLMHRIGHQLQAVPGAIGNAVAGGITSGKNIGKEIEQALKGVGQQLLGGIFTQAINGLVRQLGLNAALSQIGHAIMTGHAATMISHAGVMIGHGIVVAWNTVVTGLNTIWTAALTAIEAVKAIFGFADGGVPPMGVPSIVGERGPELFIPHQLGTVIPNNQLKSFAGGAGAGSRISSQSYNGGSHTFNVYGANNARQAARDIAGFLKSSGPQFSPSSR